MKLNKLDSTAIVAALTLWASYAKATPVFYQFEKLNFSLTAAQQGLENSKTSSTVKFSKITNKDILSFLATAFNTNWPAGAKLALDNNSWDIFVVDRGGTNPIFDLSTGINIGDTNVVYFSFNSDTNVFVSGKLESTKTGGFQKQTDFGMIFFHLFNEHNGITNTDLNFEGLDEAKLKNVFINNVPMPPNEITILTEVASVAGDGTFNNGTWTVVKGNVTGSGKWMDVPVGVVGPPPPP
jgi:hypothetical protein